MVGSRNLLSNSGNCVSSYHHNPSHKLTVREFRILSSATVFEIRESMSKSYDEAWCSNDFRHSYKKSPLRITNKELKFDAMSNASFPIWHGLLWPAYER